MAFSVRLTGFPVEPGKPLFQIEPTWWPANVIRKDPRMKETFADGYLDYRALLSVEDVREIHEQYRVAASQGVFGSAQWQDIIHPMITDLDAVLGVRSAEFGHFEVWVYEWESGLGLT